MKRKKKKKELNECDKIREVGPHKKVGKAKKKNSKKKRKRTVETLVWHVLL